MKGRFPVKTVGIICPNCKQINCYNFPEKTFLVKQLQAQYLKCNFCSYVSCISKWSEYNDKKTFILLPKK